MKPRCFQISGEGNQPWLLLREEDDWGLVAYDLLRPSARFWPDADDAPKPVRLRVDSGRVQALPSPVSLMDALAPDDNWLAMTRRTQGILRAWFLIAEDPQRRLESRQVCSLAHQASLVAHVVNEEHLRSVLIADEVGLGKTIEAALILQRLLHEDPHLRILYLAPARLVRNVRKEFERLELGFRIWVSGGDGDAKLSDSRVVASIHRACHPNHLDGVADTKWDVIVVDECHHLSDWGKGGGKQTRKYQLVKQLRERMGESARLIMMSGTPHQGSGYRFENLLQLLRRSHEDESAIAGRVIYRTKEDIVDWHGKPLFPKRQVNDPLIMQLAPAHRSWIEGVYELFNESPGGGASAAKRRATGWRCGQALQWATSSIQAGLGYLVRQALRADWDLDSPGLVEALKSLRPYRRGSSDEGTASLFDRIQKEIRRPDTEGDVDGDMDDVEESDSESAPWRPNEELLARLLVDGVALLADDPDSKWCFLKENILDKADGEKVVLFAQPIETVTALARYLERIDGQRPAIVMGGQSEHERQKEIESFWRDNGPRYLVSSRAGGEGINLQVARRLVHVDVPWNPMELEQRVGRVHRFMSKKTIIVDTIVVEDSREVDAYAIARQKLHDISRSLGVDEARFELLFSRVMGLVPPDEFNEVLAERPLGPLSEAEQQEIAKLVTEGFERWSSFHEQYASKKDKVAALEPGQASWGDLADLAIEYLDAKPATGVSVVKFEWGDDDEVVESSVRVSALEIDGDLFTCGDYGGMPVTSEDGRPATLLGVNSERVSDKLRELAFPGKPSGAAYLSWPDDMALPWSDVKAPFAVLGMIRQSVRADGNRWIAKEGDSLFLWVLTNDGRQLPIRGFERGQLVRGLLKGAAKRDPIDEHDLKAELRDLFDAKMMELCRPTEEDRASGTRHGVLPILSAIIG